MRRCSGEEMTRRGLGEEKTERKKRMKCKGLVFQGLCVLANPSRLTTQQKETSKEKKHLMERDSRRCGLPILLVVAQEI